MGHKGIVDDPQLPVDGDFAAWTSVFVDDRNVDTSDFELRGRHWSWLQRRGVRHYVSVSIFVLGPRHFDESFASGGQDFRGDSVDQRCVQSEFRRVPSPGPDSPRNCLTMAGRSLLEVATKAWAEVTAQAYVFLISVRLIFGRAACAKVEALWASSGAPRVGNLCAGFFFA